MYQETVDRTKEYYSINNSLEITPIGIHYDYTDEERTIKNQIRKRRDKKDFDIILIAHADFPFKGYIIGLIDYYVNFYKICSNSNLHIIASGKD